MKKTLLISLLCMACCCVFAQKNVEFTKTEFPKDPKGLATAKENIKNGELKIDEKNYDKALELLLKAQKFNPNNAMLNFNIGFCYYNSPQKSKSLEYFEKAYNLDNNIVIKEYNNIRFYLGRANQWNYKFDNAIKFYNDYLETKKKKTKNDDTDIINKYISECQNGKEILKDTLPVKIVNLGENVNSEFRDYGPMVVSDGSKIYFTSRRKGTSGNVFADDGQYFEDIYETSKTDAGWTKARNVGTPLNTKDHDAVVGLSPDGQQLYIYRDVNGGDIYVSQLKGSRWQTPKSVSPKINSKYHESKASLSFDGKTLYFISDNKELSIGGRDIFYSILDANGEWDDPINIGNVINTEYDEGDIFVHPDGRTLYFSSKGHNSIGGYDIFKTTIDNDGKWQKPINLGYPINTPDDDVFYVVTASGKTAYFSSYREGGLGNHDIYEIQFIEPTRKETQPDKPETKPIVNKVLVTLVKGTVTDAKTALPLEANVDIVDLSVDKTVASFLTNSQTGKYLINLPSGKNYGINVNKEGYLFHSENFNLADTTDFQELIVDIQLNRIEVGTTITLKNVFFDYDKATLRPESQTELNNVVNILNKNSKMKVEISGHTDSKGADEYNKNLSQERAKSVVDYIISKGIAEKRLTYKGYGKEKPVATNDTEEGRQQNRRVEFKIIEN